MRELFSSTPQHCLKIGAQALAWAEGSTTWRGRRRFRCVISPTPAGAVKLSPIDPNLTDQSALEERLRVLVGPSKQMTIARRLMGSDLPRPITLLLPDLSIRSTVLHLEQMPARLEEQEALIRWRLGQDQRVPLSGAKIHWQVFPPARHGEGSYAVLVVVLQEEILHQYETLCESVGLIPRRVQLASLSLMELWVKAVGRRRISGDFLWLTVADGGLTCIVFHRGRPQFVRMKLLGIESPQTEHEEYAQVSQRILHEAGASLLACQELHPETRVEHVVLATDGGLSSLQAELEQELGISVERVDWEHVRSLGWTHDGGNTSWAALPVVAGML